MIRESVYNFKFVEVKAKFKCYQKEWSKRKISCLRFLTFKISKQLYWYVAVFLKVWSLWGTFNYQKQKKEFLVEARMQKYCSKSLASSSWTSNISLFFLIIRVLYHADKFKENGFFSNIFIIRTIVKMPARDQTLLVLDSEIDHKQL